ncbi:MAG: hypothetical protein KJ626_11610 [Verrucomicrobia bacterium]|nr:hypothetical protein [Verrucomicrobiota bacterium]
MKGDLFFDTNILVYAYDSSQPRKRDIAQRLLSDGQVYGGLTVVNPFET